MADELEALFSPVGLGFVGLVVIIGLPIMAIKSCTEEPEPPPQETKSVGEHVGGFFGNVVGGYQDKRAEAKAEREAQEAAERQAREEEKQREKEIKEMERAVRTQNGEATTKDKVLNWWHGDKNEP